MQTKPTETAQTKPVAQQRREQQNPNSEKSRLVNRAMEALDPGRDHQLNYDQLIRQALQIIGHAQLQRLKETYNESKRFTAQLATTMFKVRADTFLNHCSLETLCVIAAHSTPFGCHNSTSVSKLIVLQSTLLLTGYIDFDVDIILVGRQKGLTMINELASATLLGVIVDLVMQSEHRKYWNTLPRVGRDSDY